MIVASVVKPSFYQDSLTLLRLARELKDGADVDEVTALMATPANKQLLADAGLLTSEARQAGPNDLVIAVRAPSQGEAQAALVRAEAFFSENRRTLAGATIPALPRTLESALRHRPATNLALISVPGRWAAAEARDALRRGLHVMLFSDNVSLDDEIALKREAVDAGRLLMGPDCGTSILNGVGLGFANAVPRGGVGLVAASGTGLQQVVTLLASLGEGVSHAIGVGGRDGAAAGGLMTLAALDALAADRSTDTLVVTGKPPAPEVRGRIEARVRELGKPCVLALLGEGTTPGQDGDVITVTTFEDAAHAAVALRRGLVWSPVTFTVPDREIERRARALRDRLGAERRRILGLYSGGALAQEAQTILASLAKAEIVDLGADEYTVGRPHPMLDSSFRVEKITEAARAPDLAVLLLDVVLVHGVVPDPAGDLAEAIAAVARSAAVVASVIGTREDLQNHATQVERLQAAGAWVLPSNAQAARAAAMLVGKPSSPSPPLPPGEHTRLLPSARGGRPPASGDGNRIADFLKTEIRVVNVGLETFARDLAGRGVPVVHVAWSPPAGGDPRLADLLAQLDDR